MQDVRADFFGPSARLHHVGLVVRRIAEVPLGGGGTPPVTFDPIQKVRVAFVMVGDCRIELIEPTASDSPVAAALERGGKLLHLCFEVDDLPAAAATAQTHGFRIISAPAGATAFDSRRIQWLYHGTWGLIELLERA
jgi:methylmalonyl-CoA/ethylmalonyl-CoA epimerase